MHWIKNGPEVKKPCGECLIRTKDGFTDIAQWSHDPDCLIWSNTQNVYCDDEVAHFAVIASPLSRSRRITDLTTLREITEKVRGIADANAYEWKMTTAVRPSEVFAVCDELLRILDAFDTMDGC